MNKSNVIKMIIAALMLASVMGIALFIVNYEKTTDKESVDLNLSSDIVSTDPKVSAANFITQNGTIGNLSEVDQAYFDRKFTSETNADRRMASFEKVRDAIVPDSPIITGREEDAIKNQTVDFPVFYEVRDLKVSEPSNVKPLVIHHNQIGPVEYESVDVYVDFTSAENTFYWPTDASEDNKSIITQMEAVDHFEDVKVTLVKSGDLWFIYDVEDIEYLLNVRMSTWSGRGNNDMSTEQEVINEYELDYSNLIP